MPPPRLTPPASSLALTLLLLTPPPRTPAEEAPGPTAASVTLHVAPGGDDRWSGNVDRSDPGGADGPLATLKGARDRIRAIRREAGRGRGPITVMISDGTYPVAEPIVFEPADGGTASAPVVYRAGPGAHPVLDGGRSITGFTARPDGVWTVKVPGVAEGCWTFEQLFVNGRRATRARTPGQSYHDMLKRVDRAVDPETGKDAPMEDRAFIARAEDLAPLRGLSPGQLRDVVVMAFHSWETSRHRIASADLETGLVVLTGPAPWPFFKWGPKQRYILENVPRVPDQLGEWFLSRDGTLTYKPLPGEVVATARVVAPVADAFLKIEGKPEANSFVEHLSFQGLTFRHSRYLLPPKGHGDSQAAVSIPAVIMADGARSVTLADCRVERTGTYGVWFRRGCTDCRIERCALVDLGAGGVRIGEHRIASGPEDWTDRITMDNCIVRGGGRIFPGSVGVLIGQSSENRVTHNDIGDLFYTAISVGWTWGYGESRCNRNIIEYNHIHHIGRGVLSDMGGVYTLGVSPGTSVGNNWIHDVDSYNRRGAGGWGLYNDEGSTGIRLENNLVHDTTTGSYHQHYGKDNLVRNNILAFSRYGQVMRTRAEPHLSFTFDRNIVIWRGGPLLTGDWSGRNFQVDHNLYFETTGRAVTFAGATIDEWRERTGQDRHSRIADPGFVDANLRDFRLKPGGPAAEIDFQPFDFTKAGVYGDPAWIEEARAPLPPTVFAIGPDAP